MVRMSDLVRGIASKKAAPEKPPAPKRAVAGAAPSSVGPALPRTRLAAMADVSAPPRRVAPAPPPETVPPVPVATGENAEALFGELQEFLARVREIARTGGEFPWGDLDRLIGRAVVSLDRSAELFWVANNPAVPPGIDYLASHQARVAVLSLRVGANLGYDRQRLIPLGMAGCLIDAGFWQLPEAILRKVDSLSPDEQARFESHPRLSAEMIQRWAPPHEGIVEAVLQHHEREQGQGFPQRLQGPAIHPDAKILGLVDTYAGLTVPPSSQARLRPHEVIRDIVRSKHEAFASAVIKALLSDVSVFPPGTLVRLNTGEVGRVVAVNRNHPLRPRVEIVADAKGQRQAVPKTTDLSEAPFLYITGAVAESAR